MLCLVAQLCLTPCDPTDCSRSGASVHGILQARVGCHALLQGNLLNPGIEHRSLALQADSLPSETPDWLWDKKAMCVFSDLIIGNYKDFAGHVLQAKAAFPTLDLVHSSCISVSKESFGRVWGLRQLDSSHSPWHFLTQSQVLSTPVCSPSPRPDSGSWAGPPGESKGGSWASLLLASCLFPIAVNDSRLNSFLC